MDRVRNPLLVFLMVVVSRLVAMVPAYLIRMARALRLVLVLAMLVMPSSVALIAVL